MSVYRRRNVAMQAGGEWTAIVKTDTTPDRLMDCVRNIPPIRQPQPVPTLKQLITEMWIPHVSVSSPGCGSASGRRMDSYRKGMCIFCNLASIGQPHPLSQNGQLKVSDRHRSQLQGIQSKRRVGTIVVKFYNDEVIRPWQPFHNSGLQQLLDSGIASGELNTAVGFHHHQFHHRKGIHAHVGVLQSHGQSLRFCAYRLVADRKDTNVAEAKTFRPTTIRLKKRWSPRTFSQLNRPLKALRYTCVAILNGLGLQSQTNRCADWEQAVNAPHWLMLTLVTTRTVDDQRQGFDFCFDQRRYQKIPQAECRQKSYRNCGCNLASIGQPHPLSQNGQLRFYNDEVIRPWQPFHNSGLQQLLDSNVLRFRDRSLQIAEMGEGRVTSKMAAIKQRLTSGFYE
ncbi:hypothetical protein T08_1118, partial [Trichinella sp. T8]